MAKQYVQHISGQGEKWKVTADSEEYKRWKQWKVEGEGEGPYQFHYLPKSEYVLCEPPVVWKDVTAECELVSAEDDIVHQGAVVVACRGYRYRKVQIKGSECPKTAIIIEQKVTG